MVYSALRLGIISLRACRQAAGSKGNSTSDVFSSDMHRDVSALDAQAVETSPRQESQESAIWQLMVLRSCSELFRWSFMRCLTHLGIEHENGVVTGFAP